MTRSVKVAFLVVLSLMVISALALFGGCSSSSSSTPAPTPTPTPTPTATTYSGTFFMATEGGGHIGVFPFTIDPSNATAPIKIDEANSHRVQLQGSTASTTAKIISHDVRLDAKTNRVYFSSFMVSNPTNSSTGQVGYLDVANDITANVTANGATVASIDIDAGAAATIAFALDNIGVADAGTSTPATPGQFKLVYCASGQTDDYFFPMSMSYPAYIDAIPKALITAGGHITAADIKRTFISQIDDSMNLALQTGVTGTVVAGDGTQIPLNQLGVPPLAFLHGAASHDGTKMYVSTNVMSGLTLTNSTAGVFRTYMLNTADLISGTVDTTKVVKGPDITVQATVVTGGSVAYRASFTPDDTKILQAGSDRMLILNAADLTTYVDTKGDANFGGGKTGIENHDVTTTPDGKYAILAVRYHDNASDTDKTSGLQLYDIANKKFIGGVTNTCGINTCHAPGDGVSRPTCGVVGKFK